MKMRSWRAGQTRERELWRFRPAVAVVLVSLIAIAVATVFVTRSARAAFPGENGKIVFVSDRDGNSEIYSMSSDGSDLVRLTDNPASDGDPQVSPDGSRILFESNRDEGDTEIYVMNADGSGQTRLTVSPGYDVVGTWSPDGERVAFVSTRADGNWDIYVMNADGSGVTRLTDNPGTDTNPDWSPDGTELVFWSSRSSGLGLFKMNADGTGVTQLTDVINDNEPDWSPDGQKIAFSSARDGNFEIYEMNADGSGLTRLTNSSAIDFSPSFSPDGTHIAWWRYDGQSEIFVMKADGTGGTNITNNPAEDLLPSWGSIPHASDTTPPTLSMPAAVVVEATSAAGAAVGFTVTATDDVDPNPTVVCTPPSGSVFPLGVTTVGCTATDGSGNSASGSFTVAVVDTTPPTLTLTANTVVDATGPGGAAVSYAATATDTVDSSPAVDCVPPSGTMFVVGTTTVSCTATDRSGNSAHGSFTIKVKSGGEQLADLAAAVKGVGPGKSLEATVEVAQWFMAHGQPQLACMTLTAFQLEVRAQSGKKIPAAQATTLIADARRIRSVLGCTS